MKLATFHIWLVFLTLGIMNGNEDFGFFYGHSIFFLIFQARPEVDSLEEIDMNEDEEDQEANLFVPGSSYIKLLSLTPAAVLGGIIYPVFKVTLQGITVTVQTCSSFRMECHNKVQPFFFLLTNDGKKRKVKNKAHNPLL